MPRIIFCLHYPCLVPHCQIKISLAYSWFNNCRRLRTVLSTFNMADVTFNENIVQGRKKYLKENTDILSMLFLKFEEMVFWWTSCPDTILSGNISKGNKKLKVTTSPVQTVLWWTVFLELFFNLLSSSYFQWHKSFLECLQLQNDVLITYWYKLCKINVLGMTIFSQLISTS